MVIQRGVLSTEGKINTKKDKEKSIKVLITVAIRDWLKPSVKVSFVLECSELAPWIKALCGPGERGALLSYSESKTFGEVKLSY